MSYHLDVYCITKTKLSRITNSFVYRLWNNLNVKWHGINLEDRSGGLLVMWNNDSFEVSNIEFNSQWIALFGTHIEKGFKCVVIYLYDGVSLEEGKKLYEELIILNFAL
jgi:hypothetical protein